tara:strand:- start:13 stop:906 length:894 start_codon:yes stop_codon:yes gene_type:complete
LSRTREKTKNNGYAADYLTFLAHMVKKPKEKEQIMFIDSHCHLDFPDFEEDGLESVVARASDAGVGQMVTICTHITKFPQIRDIAARFDNIFCTVGTHPHNAGEEAEKAYDCDAIIALADSHEKVVGIGETGLDYYYDNAPRERQMDSFRHHLKACAATGLPVIVHTRDADDDTAAILKEEYAGGKLTGVMHCFSSGAELAKKALDLGFYISLSGIITFKKADDLREIVKTVPLDRVLIETDSPYLAPVPMRGRRNEPAFVAHTAAKLAEIKGVSTEEIGKITTENFYRLFKKVKRL